MSNKFSEFQKAYYTAETPTMKIMNHTQHNKNPDYWNILLGDVKDNPQRWVGKNALDFGCGCGRNLYNMSTLADWATVDGVDISKPNIEESREYMKLMAPHVHVDVYENSGYDLTAIESDKYHFVMSTIVFQHIPVREIRLSLKREIFRVMKSGGLFSFQMGAGGKASKNWCPYMTDGYDIRTTNGGFDVSVDDSNLLLKDLTDIGFTELSHVITPPFDDDHKNWIWVKARKP